LEAFCKYRIDHVTVFAGCGMHVEEVLGDVPKDERCQCERQRTCTIL